MKRYYYKLNVFDDNLLKKMTKGYARWRMEKIYHSLSKTGISFYSINGSLFYTEDIHDLNYVIKILNTYGIELLRLDPSTVFTKVYVEPKIKELIDLALTTDNQEISMYLSRFLGNMKKTFGVK